MDINSSINAEIEYRAARIREDWRPARIRRRKRRHHESRQPEGLSGERTWIA